LPGLRGESPEQVFREFRAHLNRLLHTTITDASLGLLGSGTRVRLEFWQSGERRCAYVGNGFYLFIGQTLEAVQERDQFRLRTLSYAYRITEGPSFGDPWIIRWEYESREVKPGLHPRHHCHIRDRMQCHNDRTTLDLSHLHLPSGWITIEEVIRFLVHELELEPRSKDWDRLLLESEELFREWTGRRV
jgi:hypothetical protein